MVVTKASTKFIATLINRYVASLSATVAITDGSKIHKKPHLPPPPNNYIPDETNYRLLYLHRFTLKQLQKFAKMYHIKTSDVKKDVLIHHIYMYFILKTKAVTIQAIARGYLLRTLLKLQGFLKPNRTPFSRTCINDTDFATLEDIHDIPVEYFYGYEIENKAGTEANMYGFNITSLYNYCFIKGMKFATNGDDIINPYTREPFRDSFADDIYRVIQLSNTVFHRPLCLEIEEPTCTAQQQMELKAVSVFQTLNELGNYSDVNWFLRLSRDAIAQYIKEFYDIWNHRAGLSQQQKSELYPPDGNLFRNNLQYRILHEPDVCIMKSWLLDVFSRMVQTNYVPIENRKLNAMYILAGLTLVCPAAADAMPVYFFSVSSE